MVTLCIETLALGLWAVLVVRKLAFDDRSVAVKVIRTADPFFTLRESAPIVAEAFAVRWPVEVVPVALAILVSVLALPVKLIPPLKAVVLA
jgi:hypothetical protein